MNTVICPVCEEEAEILPLVDENEKAHSVICTACEHTWPLE